MVKKLPEGEPIPIEKKVPEPEDWTEYGLPFFWLFERLRVLLLESGEELRGFSFSSKPDGWLLCVRMTDESIPVVVFSKKLAPMDCIANLKRRYEEGTLQIFPDRFA